MMETAKKIFKVGIYGQIEKMVDYLEKRYGVTNGWLNFSYTVGEFPENFKKTCLYLGLKEALENIEQMKQYVPTALDRLQEFAPQNIIKEIERLID